MRILIAEDETIVRLDLRGVLERAGHEVLEARDGGEAVVLAGEWCPDLAILDVKMPVLDGVEAARRINAAAPLPIVLLTAYADEGTIARAVGAGVFGYLIKPFRESEIAPGDRDGLGAPHRLADHAPRARPEADPGDGDRRRRRRRHAPLPAARSHGAPTGAST